MMLLGEGSAHEYGGTDDMTDPPVGQTKRWTFRREERLVSALDFKRQMERRAGCLLGMWKKR